MSLFLSSGEASGDHYTANIAKTLRAAGYSGELWGMGGVESREAGIRVEWPGERLQLLGITEVLSSIPYILRLLNDMADRIMELNPEGVIVADSPDYHMRLISRLRKRGYKGMVFYISPPSVWAWRSSRANDLRAYVDECMPLFKFEHEYLVKRGCRSYWKGHPLLESSFDHESICGNIPKGLLENGNLVAFLPGSRGNEIRALLPVMEGAAEELMRLGWHPVFSVAPGLDPEIRALMIERFKDIGFDYYEGSGRDLLAASKCAVGASGTITVESLLLGCYMIVVYKLNPISAFLAKCFVKTRYVTIANILVDSEVFPELLQHNATSGNIIKHALKWLEGGEDERSSVLEKMSCARAMMGEPGAYKYWAERVLEAIS